MGLGFILAAIIGISLIWILSLPLWLAIIVGFSAGFIGSGIDRARKAAN
jgi:hypothetical protein